MDSQILCDFAPCHVEYFNCCMVCFLVDMRHNSKAVQVIIGKQLKTKKAARLSVNVVRWLI